MLTPTRASISTPVLPLQVTVQVQAMPQTITKTTVTCDHLHNLHSVGLNILSKDDVMAAWNFSDVDKEWFEITYKGFQVNPDINADP